MPTVPLNDPPRITLLPDQVAALGINELPKIGAVYALTADAVVESTGIPGLHPSGANTFALRLQLRNVSIETGA